MSTEDGPLLRDAGWRSAAGAVIVSVLLFAQLGCANGDRAPRAADEGDCGAAAVFGGRTYYAVSVPGNKVIPQVPGPLGTAIEECGGATGSSVDVYAIAGIDPRVALARADNTVVYVPNGRCDGFRGWNGFFRCLTRRLELGGSRYTALRLARPAPVAAAAGTGVLERPGHPPVRVRVLSIAGVPREQAVALAKDPRQVFVADGVCDRVADVPFEECLGLS